MGQNVVSHDVVAGSHRLDGTTEQLTTYYGSWAATYDRDVHNVRYQGPHVITDLFASVVPRHLSGCGGLTALDAGCGTGLVGQLLDERSVTALDGIDLNHDMISLAAKTNAYRILASGVDLNLGLREIAEDTYDVTVCCGVFTPGHVRPAAVDGLIRVTRPDGLVLLSTRRRYLDETDFEQHLGTLVDDGRVSILECHADRPYTADEPAQYRILTVRK
ncbi:methyltransferase domain-containing protein [Streptomyces sp. SID8354]|nr:methyltransferase domain-containing protein [Streptomyces sp. SID8354]